MSSAILLAAIVAIWACALVPRWVRRTHAAPGQTQETFEAEETYPAVSSPGDENFYGTEQPYDTRQPYGTEPAYETDPSYDTEQAFDPEQEYATQYEPAARQADAGELPGHPPVTARPRTTAGRGRVLQARRRTLTMLVLLVIAAAACRVLGFAHSWIVIPPVVMLGTYLLVLRAAVHADTENAARRAAAQARAAQRARAAAAAEARAAAAREALQPPAPEPTAEVIDIAAHARPDDQLYDQYEDATARAIGD